MSDKLDSIHLSADQMSLLMLVTALDPDEPLELEPRRPLLYCFQHIALREAAFINHPELIKELTEPLSNQPLIHFWSMACLRCEEAGLFADEAALSEWIDAIQIRSYVKDGFTIYFVTMPEPQFSLETYFVAIVYKDEPHKYGRESPSTRYFTLEKADYPAARPLLCEWFSDGSRKNHGEGPVPTQEAFADAVFDL